VRGPGAAPHRLLQAPQHDLRQGGRRPTDGPLRDDRRGRHAPGPEHHQAEDARSRLERVLRARRRQRQDAHDDRLPRRRHTARRLRRQLQHAAGGPAGPRQGYLGERGVATPAVHQNCANRRRVNSRLFTSKPILIYCTLKP
jgi:hypothetical protein